MMGVAGWWVVLRRRIEGRRKKKEDIDKARRKLKIDARCGCWTIGGGCGWSEGMRRCYVNTP